MKLAFVLLTGLLSFAQSPPSTQSRGIETRAVQNTPGDELSSVTMQRAQVLFQRFQRETSIPYNFPIDGCYARATAMARIAQKQGLTMGKVFTTGMLQVKTGNPAYPLVQWGWHVAPTINVRTEDGQVQRMVFDPSLFDRPVTVEEWNQRMLDEVPPEKGGFKPVIHRTFFTSRHQQFPNGTDATYWRRQVLNNTLETMEMYRPFNRPVPARTSSESAPAAEEGTR